MPFSTSGPGDIPASTLTHEDWIRLGICPECIHDMIPVNDGSQLCPECGFHAAKNAAD